MRLAQAALRMLEHKLSEPEREILPTLTAFAERFRRAGGAISDLGGIEALEPVEFVAMIAAGDRLAVLEAIRIAKASSGPVGEAEVLAEIDGGEQLQQRIDEAKALALLQRSQERAAQRRARG